MIMSEKVDILNLKISSESLDDIIEKSITLIKQKTRHYICVPNAYLTVVANENRQVLDIINNAGFTVPDGMPLVWYSKIFKNKLKRRISGSDLFAAYCRKLEEEKMSCFFMGGESREVVGTMIGNLKKKYANLEIKGFFVPPFVEKIEGSLKDEINKEINNKKPDVVWVGLSAPKQEIWIYDNLESLDIMMACGVGAVFNFYAGKVKRAPVWVQKIGMEWFYRILAEPKRLLKKYLVYNTKFMGLVIRDILKSHQKTQKKEIK